MHNGGGPRASGSTAMRDRVEQSILSRSARWTSLNGSELTLSLGDHLKSKKLVMCLSFLSASSAKTATGSQFKEINQSISQSVSQSINQSIN